MQLIKMLFQSILPNQSRARRLQYRWYKSVFINDNLKTKVLDLGGVAGAEYHGALGIDSKNVLVWNFAPETNPAATVDLDQVADFPDFPTDCSLVLAMNLLEHLYHPFKLLEWVCNSLPSGGSAVILVPFMYPIHPSPNDYWRITPQCFDRFFCDWQKANGQKAEWKIEELGEDYREVFTGVTAPMFKGSKLQRIIASSLELIARVVSFFVAKKKLQAWVKTHPTAIGIVWTKK